MKKLVSKNDYRRFCNGRTFNCGASHLTHINEFSAAFIVVFFTHRQQLTPVQCEKINEIAVAKGEIAAREYIEQNLIRGMGIEDD